MNIKRIYWIIIITNYFKCILLTFIFESAKCITPHLFIDFYLSTCYLIKLLAEVKKQIVVNYKRLTKSLFPQTHEYYIYMYTYACA